MGYEYNKVHNTEVARDSISGTNSTNVLHDIQGQSSNEIKCQVLGGHLDLVDSGTTGTRIHITSGVDSNRTKLYTVGGENADDRVRLPEVPFSALKTDPGKNLGLEISDSGPVVVATVIVAEEY